MPVRGHGWYKRPYKFRATYDRSQMVIEDGPETQTFAFHWKGARDKAAADYRLMSHVRKVEVWDEPVDTVQIRT